MPTGGVGPRVQATTALCTGAYHLSKRPTQELLADRFGVELGLGTIAHLEQATTQAVAEARASVQTQPAAYADETDGREGRQRAWLGTVVTPGSRSLWCGPRVMAKSPGNSWARTSGGGW